MVAFLIFIFLLTSDHLILFVVLCCCQDGKKPYQLADRKLRRRLRKAIVRRYVVRYGGMCRMDGLYCQDEQKYAVLYAEGSVRPEIMKLCFIGSEGAGKTTLMEALKRGLLKWIFAN